MTVETMIPILVMLLGLVGGLQGKPLPPIQEPDWEAWKAPNDPTTKSQITKAWQVLDAHRPDQDYVNREELRRAKEKVNKSYAILDAHPIAACEVGVEMLQDTDDDWLRLMIASFVSDVAGEKGKPLLRWAMASSKSVDDVFEPAFETAYWLADKHRSEFLPAMFLMLRAREGSVFLAPHSWYIPTHDCMFYVFGRYGRDVIPYLYPMLRDDDPYVRRNAAFVLGYFMDKNALPTLLKMLDANDVGSGGAAFALGQLGYLDTAPRIARLLKNLDSRTRFWSAYALYELGSKAVLPELEDALKLEKVVDTRKEIEVAIKHLRAKNARQTPNAKKLTRQQLQKALRNAIDENGLGGDVEGIAASAGCEDLAVLEDLRLECMKVFSDQGNKWFRSWSDAIKTVRRRCN